METELAVLPQALRAGDLQWSQTIYHPGQDKEEEAYRREITIFFMCLVIPFLKGVIEQDNLHYSSYSLNIRTVVTKGQSLSFVGKVLKEVTISWKC